MQHKNVDSMEFKLQLIEFVREHRCLFDINDPSYKDIYLKEKLWSSIAKELNDKTNTVKRKWKALRDGYTKYKKLLRSAHGKSIKYSWSSHLSFLDCNADTQDDSLNSCMVVEDPSSISDTPEFIRTFTISPNMLEDIPEIIDDSNSDTEPAQGEYDNPSKKQKIEEQFEVLGPVQNADAMQNTNDSVDYLFLSYAQAFKNFSLKKQAILKVDIASLFSEAELCELSRKTDKT